MVKGQFNKVKTIIIALIISIVFTSITAWFVFNRTRVYYQHKIDVSENLLKSKLADKDKQLLSVTNFIDTNYLKQSFRIIDSSLYNIDRSLSARGLGSLKIKNVGGGSGLQISDIEEFVNYYKSYTQHVESRLLFTPLGLPYDGEQTSGFGYRRDPLMPDSLESHFGLDFKGNIGDSIRTTADGVVRLAGFNGGYGNCVIITHSNNYETLYGHMSKVLVTAGTKVKAGDKIGLLGNTGRSTGPHVHYEVMQNGVKINPARFLKLQSP